MSLRQQAAKDLTGILENNSSGFGHEIDITAPDGTVMNLIGETNDVSQMIDPDTGMMVSGRTATISLRASSVAAAFQTQGEPQGIADKTSKPWLVKFDDVDGRAFTFKITESRPDRTLGLINYSLELYTLAETSG